jgi:hypothetical protein
MATERVCPECGAGTVVPIRVLDYGGRQGHVIGFQYSAIDAKRSIWNGSYPPAGTIRAEMCSSCGRVLFYACPAGGEPPIPCLPPEQERESLPLPSEAPREAAELEAE